MSPRIRVINSSVIEAASYFDQLCKSAVKAQSDTELQGYVAKLTTNEKIIFEDLLKIAHPGMLLIEYLLDYKIFDDIIDLRQVIDNLAADDFIYRLLGGGSIDINKVLALINNQLSWHELMAIYPYLDDKLAFVIEDINLFRQVWLDALLFFAPQSKFEAPSAQLQIKYLEQQLNKATPLAVAQSVMGKTFKMVADYQDCCFVVSPITGNPIRYFNNQTLIVICPTKSQMVDNIARQLKVLADPSRIKIIRLLARETLYGKQIAERLTLSTATISHHLEALNSAGLLLLEKEKNIKYFHTNKSAIRLLSNRLVHHLLEDELDVNL